MEQKPKPIEIKKPDPVVENKKEDVAIKNEEKDFNLGELFQGKQGGAKANLNAKKLDIDFDNDDFFNQFDPAAIAKQQEKEAEERRIEKAL